MTDRNAPQPDADGPDHDDREAAGGGPTEGKNMTETVKTKITETRARIEERTARVRDGIVTRKDEIVDKGRRIKGDLERKRDVTVGKLRDGGLERLYGVSEQALRKVANVVETASRLSRVDALNKPAEKLRHRAENLEGAREGLHKPPIADYDSLNVKQVTAALDGLTAYDLEKVRAYEAANKERKTVLRELDRLLGDDD